MILVLLLPFTLAVILGLVHKPEVALETTLTGLVAEYRETKSLTLSTLNEVNEARRQGNTPDPQELTRVLRQVSKQADAIWSHYSERRQSSAQQGANAADVPVIFILLAATRALEEEVQAELSSELREHSQSTTALRAAHSDILRLADEELQKTSEFIDRS